jgi:CTD small phosphatase-like protein 2
MIIHNYEIEKYVKKKEEKEKDFKNKSNKSISRKLNRITNTNIKTYNKNAFNSNRNLTKITINPKTVENKDIHLVFKGRKETIINYTNQEMVDDENQYMLECLKVLLKLKKEEQPRCKQKVNFNFPESENKKKIALFDLDETLVHCTKDQKGLNGDVVDIKLPTNKTVQVGLNIRSHWKEALDLIKNKYNIVVYTASHQSYADAVLNYIDKENKYFQYRLYRNHCVQCDVDGVKFYVKDLDTLDKYYNLKDVVLIDNSVLSFAYHLNNGIPIVPFIEQRDDTQLLMLAYYLVSIASFDDLTQENKKHINIEHFLLLAKKCADEELEEEQNNKNNDNTEKNDDDNKNIENSEDKNNDNNNDNSIKESSQIKKGDSKDSSSSSCGVFTKKSFLIKTSEKALKIAKDMNKNIGGIYKKNYK